MSENQTIRREEGKNLGILSEPALLLAALSFFLYSIAFSYEAGYCSYFRIPLNFVSVTSSTLPSSLLSLLLSSVLLIAYFTQAWSIFLLCYKKIKEGILEFHAIKIIHASYVMFGIIILLSYLLFSKEILFNITVTCLSLFFILNACVVCTKIYLIFLKMCLTSRKRFVLQVLEQKNPGFLERYKRKNEARAPKNKKFIHTKSCAFYIFLFSLILIIAYSLGLDQAIKKRSFLFLEENKNFAIIQHYDDVLIAVDIDKTSGRSSGRYLFIPLKKEPFIQFKEETITPIPPPEPHTLIAKILYEFGAPQDMVTRFDAIPKESVASPPVETTPR